MSKIVRGRPIRPLQILGRKLPYKNWLKILDQRASHRNFWRFGKLCPKSLGRKEFRSGILGLWVVGNFRPQILSGRMGPKKLNSKITIKIRTKTCLMRVDIWGRNFWDKIRQVLGAWALHDFSKISSNLGANWNSAIFAASEDSVKFDNWDDDFKKWENGYRFWNFSKAKRFEFFHLKSVREGETGFHINFIIKSGYFSCVYKWNEAFHNIFGLVEWNFGSQKTIISKLLK